MVTLSPDEEGEDEEMVDALSSPPEELFSHENFVQNSEERFVPPVQQDYATVVDQPHPAVSAVEGYVTTPSNDAWAPTENASSHGEPPPMPTQPSRPTRPDEVVVRKVRLYDDDREIRTETEKAIGLRETLFVPPATVRQPPASIESALVVPHKGGEPCVVDDEDSKQPLVSTERSWSEERSLLGTLASLIRFISLLTLVTIAFGLLTHCLCETKPGQTHTACQLYWEQKAEFLQCEPTPMARFWHSSLYHDAFGSMIGVAPAKISFAVQRAHPCASGMMWRLVHRMLHRSLAQAKLLVL